MTLVQPRLRPAISVLAFLAFCLFAMEASAQSGNTPATKNSQLSKEGSLNVALVPSTTNPQFNKIASLYDALEYEKALALIPKAERHPTNRLQERLWLELMKGVLHHGLREPAKADTAFMRALEQSPSALLPILTASQTLHERFEMLRGQALQERELKQRTEKLSPQVQVPLSALLSTPSSVPSKGVATKDESKQEKIATTPQRADALPQYKFQVSDVDSQVLFNKFYELEGWVDKRSQGQKIPEDLSNELDACFRDISAARTVNDRMVAAMRLDGLREQLGRRYEPQGSGPQVAPLLPHRSGDSAPTQ